MITEQQAEAAVNFMRDHADEHAQAKAERMYLQEYTKSLRAKLFNDAPGECKTVAEKENFAFAHADYHTHLIGLKAAVHVEESLKWKMEAAKIKCAMWQTTEASARAQVRSAT